MLFRINRCLLDVSDVVDHSRDFLNRLLGPGEGEMEYGIGLGLMTKGRRRKGSGREEDGLSGVHGHLLCSLDGLRRASVHGRRFSLAPLGNHPNHPDFVALLKKWDRHVDQGGMSGAAPRAVARMQTRVKGNWRGWSLFLCTDKTRRPPNVNGRPMTSKNPGTSVVNGVAGQLPAKATVPQ